MYEEFEILAEQLEIKIIQEKVILMVGIAFLNMSPSLY